MALHDFEHVFCKMGRKCRYCCSWFAIFSVCSTSYAAKKRMVSSTWKLGHMVGSEGETPLGWNYSGTCKTRQMLLEISSEANRGKEKETPEKMKRNSANAR